MDDYLDLMQDATEEYKAQLKKVNPDFDTEHYDRLILRLEDPQTPAPEDPVGFDQLDQIGTPGNTTSPSITGADAEASNSLAASKPVDPPIDQPADPPIEQQAA